MSAAKAKFIPSYLTEDSVCVVCQQKASGKHYGAIACEGCKGFFRRTIQHSRQDKYVCTGGSNNCSLVTMTKSTKSNTYCQLCRYNKCIATGFQIDRVLDTFRRVAQNKLREENRRKRHLVALAEASKRKQEADNCAVAGERNIGPRDASSVLMQTDASDNHSSITSLDQNSESDTVQNDVNFTTDVRAAGIETNREFFSSKSDILRKLTAAFQTCLTEIPGSDDGIPSDETVHGTSSLCVASERDLSKTQLSRVFIPTIHSARKFATLLTRNIFNVSESDANMLEWESVWDLMLLMLVRRYDADKSALSSHFGTQDGCRLTDALAPALVDVWSTIVGCGKTLSEWRLDELSMSLSAAVIVFNCGKMLYLELADFNKVNDIRNDLCTWLIEHLKDALQIKNDFELGPFFRFINHLSCVAPSVGEIVCCLSTSTCIPIPAEILPLVHPFQRRVINRFFQVVAT